MSSLGLGPQDSSIDRTMQALKETATDKAVAQTVEQKEISQDAQEALKESVNPFARRLQNRKELSTRNVRVSKLAESSDKAKEIQAIAFMKQSAEEFESHNPELKAKVLVLLREYIKPDDDAETILAKVKEFYEDVSLADEAFEFLLETTDGELNQKVQEARDLLHQQSEREIIAGRNIGGISREASADGLGTPSNLRDMYRDISGNPRDANTLFQELSQRYAFKDLKKVIEFLFHSVGAELNAKGPSIPRGLLHNLLMETRSLQAILGVYTFFRGRMDLIESLFEKNGLEMTGELTFEMLAKIFMVLVSDRYPTSDKVLQGTSRLGIEKWVMAKIIAISQLRDAIREVAMSQIYRSVQHRDEVFAAIIEALELLEEELEELLEKQEEEAEGDEDEDEDEDDEDDEDENDKKA